MEYNTIHGEGTLTFPNGTIFKGHFNNGVPNGEAGKAVIQLIMSFPRLKMKR